MYGAGEYEPMQSDDGLEVLLSATEVGGVHQAPVSQPMQATMATG